MSTKQSIEARVQSLTEELRSRRSSSEKQAEQALRGDRREADDRDDESAAANESEELSTSERQARRAVGRNGRGWIAEGGD